MERNIEFKAFEADQQKLEDLAPDIETKTPEEQVQTKELWRSVKRSLQEMPRKWRRMLLLHDVQGRSQEEIAKEMGKADSEIDRDLQSSREYLRQKLIDSGFHFKPCQERVA
jgi:RNA polymerase sigma factor (sigma-70 family)